MDHLPDWNVKTHMEPLFIHQLCIRPFSTGDAALFVEAARESVSSVGRWLPWYHEAYSLSEAESWFASCAPGLRAVTACELGVFSRNGQQLYGGIAINRLKRDRHSGNVGYWVRQSRQRQGIASEAVTAIARHGFNALQLTRLELVIAEEKTASRRVAEKAGARFEGLARHPLVIRGKPCSAVVYSLAPDQRGAESHR